MPHDLLFFPNRVIRVGGLSADENSIFHRLMGYGQFSYGAGGVSDTKTGPILGGKGGVYFGDNFWLALDYHLGGPYKLANNDNEYLNRMWGAGAGIIHQKVIRVWAGYYYSAVIDDIENNQLYQGTGFALSCGIDLRSKLSINLEYSKQQYTSIRTSGQTYTPPTALDVSVIFLSLSAPIALF